MEELAAYFAALRQFQTHIYFQMVEYWQLFVSENWV